MEKLVLFKKSMSDFFDDLISALPEEEDLQIMRIFLLDQLETEMIIDQFVRYVLPYREMIEKEDEKYFLETDGIFTKLNTGKVSHFKKIWNSRHMDAENKKVVFSWFKHFIKLVEQIKKK